MDHAEARLEVKGDEPAIANLEAYASQQFDLDILPGYRCSATTTDGDRCENTVDELGGHCGAHSADDGEG